MKRSPLRISGGADAEYRDWPVTQGIPFADGELERDTPVRVVDCEGTPMPTQCHCLTTWNADQRFVRWLLAFIGCRHLGSVCVAIRAVAGV